MPLSARKYQLEGSHVITESLRASSDTSSLNLFRQMRASRKAFTPSSLSVKLNTVMITLSRAAVTWVVCHDVAGYGDFQGQDERIMTLMIGSFFPEAGDDAY